MQKYLVKPDTRVNLHDFDPDSRSEFGGTKKDAEEELKEIEKELDDLQERLYAEGKHAVLFVIQAMDTGGKDGTIRKVFGNLNPAGCRVASFKAPTSTELAHDYLWRVHAVLPRRGEIGVFNRSQYEDVLVVRVHNLVPQEVWERRFDQINAFEKMLSEEGTTIVKFFLHISKEEQKERLEARLQDPGKHWKFNAGDLRERALWKDYQEAYQDVLSKTSTVDAPWYIIPANRKWYRNVIVARVVRDTLKGLNPQYPQTTEDLSRVVIE
jgi:PPK2 family polyphosphate:nucleotide phosphotransferase